MAESMSGELHNLWLRTTEKADRDLLYRAGGRLHRLNEACKKALSILNQLPSSDLHDEVESLLREGDLD